MKKQMKCAATKKTSKQQKSSHQLSNCKNKCNTNTMSIQKQTNKICVGEEIGNSRKKKKVIATNKIVDTLTNEKSTSVIRNPKKNELLNNPTPKLITTTQNQEQKQPQKQQQNKNQTTLQIHPPSTAPNIPNKGQNKKQSTLMITTQNPIIIAGTILHQKSQKLSEEDDQRKKQFVINKIRDKKQIKERKKRQKNQQYLIDKQKQKKSKQTKNKQKPQQIPKKSSTPSDNQYQQKKSQIQTKIETKKQTQINSIGNNEKRKTRMNSKQQKKKLEKNNKNYQLSEQFMGQQVNRPTSTAKQEKYQKNNSDSQQQPQIVKKKPIPNNRNKQLKHPPEQPKTSQPHLNPPPPPPPPPPPTLQFPIIHQAPTQPNSQPPNNQLHQQQQQQQGQFQISIKDLSFNAFEGDLRDLFSDCNNILHIKIITRYDGKSKGKAFIKFGSRKSYQMALLKNGISYMGRILIVEGVEKKSSEEQEKEGNKNKSPSEKQKCSIETPTLFIGGLSNSSNVDSLKNFFATVGAVQNVRIIVEKQTNMSKGFGFVQFYDVETARKAYEQLNGHLLDGRTITLDSVVGKDKFSSDGSTNQNEKQGINKVSGGNGNQEEKYGKRKGSR